MKLRQIREAQKRKNKNNISQMRERLCRLTYLYADGPFIGMSVRAPRNVQAVRPSQYGGKR